MAFMAVWHYATLAPHMESVVAGSEEEELRMRVRSSFFLIFFPDLLDRFPRELVIYLRVCSCSSGVGEPFPS